MNKIPHYALFLSNKVNKQALINQLLQNKISEIFRGKEDLKGLLFSAITVNEMMEEEVRYDRVEVATKANRQLRYLSGGEQKKALLEYLLSQQPNFIIADNPFDNLDIASHQNLRKSFKRISLHTPIIQIVNRSADLLPFIKNILYVNDENIIYSFPNIETYLRSLKNKSEPFFQNPIPCPDKPILSTTEELIKFTNVTIKYEDKVIVENINWQINAGEFWHLTGANGTGKTTLLSIITGDNVKGYGQDIMLFGKRKGTGETVWDLKKSIGYFTAAITYLFSRYTTVEQMIISGYFDSVGLYTKPSDRQIKLADQWLDLIGMLPKKKMLFNVLSLGQQRMILIIRAMVKHPPLLILDEPAAGLDDENVKVITSLINKIAAESKTAILYVSHRAEEGLHPNCIYKLTAKKNGSTGTSKKL